eukprot:scaffold15406_cov119-Isochrysis_galbana.AAC.5
MRTPVRDVLLKWCVTRNRTQIFVPNTLFDLDTFAMKVPFSSASRQRPGHGSMTSPSPDEDRGCMMAHVPTLPVARNRAREGGLRGVRAPQLMHRPRQLLRGCWVFACAPVARPNRMDIAAVRIWIPHALEQQCR